MTETITFLYNGTIHTLDPAYPHAQALAIRDGRILAVGSTGKVRAAAAGARVEGIDLNRRTVLPGLTDAHVHITWYGLSRQRVRLADVSSLDAALQRIGEQAATLPPDAWLQGGGWNHTDWGIDWPTRYDLDRVCPDRPVALVRKDGHSIWANSRALALAGITDDTPDPSGGQILRDADGVAIGMLTEAAMDVLRRVVPEPRPTERLQALQAAIQEGLQYGLTSLHIPPGPRDDDGHETLIDLQTLYQQGALHVRCLAHIAAREFDAMLALGLRTGLGDDWLRIGGLKLFADGSLGSETAAMLHPYEQRAHRGLTLIEPERLKEMVTRANRAGINVVVHAIGDAANRNVLDAIAHAQQAIATLAEDERHPLLMPNRIEHAQVVQPEDIRRFVELGVIASMQPGHATSDMHMADRLWGERCAYAYALQAFQAAGATLALGSDAPIETLNPWAGVHAAVTRCRPDGTPLGGWYPDQRLSLRDALRGYCTGPAIASAEAHQKGMLAPGMLADLVVLPVDPFKVAPADLHTIRADMTLVGGQVRYERR
ncbi:MAG: amidohydrolase [Chloroflexaceae bacterium]|nr:amidohydrolase [Chloroflexaceae bacterium]